MTPATAKLQIDTPRWAIPLLAPARYKGARGGRGSGKSHFFAEHLVEEHIINPHKKSVCIREIQKSLKFSAKALIEGKIRKLGVGHLFEITTTEIRRLRGSGIVIFQGMQDHTADSIKSLEDFDTAWVEEAQSLSQRSLRLLRPTIRKEGSEIWFSWNPENEDDPVDEFMVGGQDCGPDNPILELLDDEGDRLVCVHVNYYDNPFLPDTLYKEMLRDRKRSDPAVFAHVWEGEYLKNSDRQILKNWRVADFTPAHDWNGPYMGLDFGFAQDPTAAVKCWIHANKLYIERESGKVELELDATADYVKKDIPGIERFALRADSARPESISYLRRHGLPKIQGVEKWKGSVEDGIEHIKSYDEVIIHPRCTQTQREARLYSYKVDRLTGDVLPVVVDAHNHFWDAVRYALAPLIKAGKQVGVFVKKKHR